MKDEKNKQNRKTEKGERNKNGSVKSICLTNIIKQSKMVDTL